MRAACPSHLTLWRLSSWEMGICPVPSSRSAVEDPYVNTLYCAMLYNIIILVVVYWVSRECVVGWRHAFRSEWPFIIIIITGIITVLLLYHFLYIP